MTKTRDMHNSGRKERKKERKKEKKKLTCFKQCATDTENRAWAITSILLHIK